MNKHVNDSRKVEGSDWLPPTLRKEDEVQLERSFGFHPATGDSGEVHEEWRDRFKHLAEIVCVNMMPSRERSLALTKLEEALFWVSADVARQRFDINQTLAKRKNKIKDSIDE